MSQHPNITQQFTAHWMKCQNVVAAFVRTSIRDEHHAEDVIQEVAQAAAAHFDQYDDSRPFAGWAIGIAKQKIAQHIRKQKRDRHVFNDEVIAELATAHEDVAGEAHQRSAALNRCIEQLKGRNRKVLEMRYLRSMKPSDVAERMGMSTNAVFVMLHRVRQALASCIDGQIARGGDR